MEPTQKTKAIAVGDSLYVRIPAPYCKTLKIEKGTPIVIHRNGRRIVYSKEDDDFKQRPGQADTESRQPEERAIREEPPVCNVGGNESSSVIGAAASAAIRAFNSGHRSVPEEHPGDAGADGGRVTVDREPEPPAYRKEWGDTEP